MFELINQQPSVVLCCVVPFDVHHIHRSASCDWKKHVPYLLRGRSAVIRASEFKSKDLGFDPLTGQGEGQFFCPSESTFVQTCLCLHVLLVRVYGTHPNLCTR